MLHEGTVKASRRLREDFAKTLREAGFKRSSRLLREGFAEPPRCLSGESPSRRHRDVFAVPSRRHYGGFMNPSFEAFVDPPDGSHEKHGTRSNREGQFSPPEAHIYGGRTQNPTFRPLLLRRPPKKAIFGFWRRKTAVFRSA